jgi:hypothetical protein
VAMTKFYSASALILLASASQSFHVQAPSRRGGGFPLCMSQQDDSGSSRRDFARNFGVATIASILSLNAACASAAPSCKLKTDIFSCDALFSGTDCLTKTHS